MLPDPLPAACLACSELGPRITMGSGSPPGVDMRSAEAGGMLPRGSAAGKWGGSALGSSAGDGVGVGDPVTSGLVSATGRWPHFHS